jgi:AraC-like DNA-binding protein
MNQQEAALLSQVRNYINTNLHRPLPVAAICRQFHISKTKLQGSFHESLGCSIHAFILRQRMQKAARWLRETGEPVKRVAWECGYRNVRSFNKTFKNQWQLSPDHYRKQHKPGHHTPAPGIKSNTLPSESDTPRLGKGCNGIVT